jgi:hypothetical protein
MVPGIKPMQNVPNKMDFLFEFWTREGHSGPYEELLAELLRFFALTRATDEPLAMISAQIDDLWHSFICITEKYFEFCNAEYGEIIHHRPLTSVTPVPETSIRNFVETYRNTYGEPGTIWFVDVPPSVVDFAYRRVCTLPFNYRWSGWPGRRAINKPSDIARCRNNLAMGAAGKSPSR